jgi:ATP-binding cassette subfamily B (MDR/TAP) protein 1
LTLSYPAFGILYGQALTNFSLNDPAERQHESFRSGLWYFIMAILAAAAIMIQNYSLIRESFLIRFSSWPRPLTGS